MKYLICGNVCFVFFLLFQLIFVNEVESGNGSTKHDSVSQKRFTQLMPRSTIFHENPLESHLGERLVRISMGPQLGIGSDAGGKQSHGSSHGNELVHVVKLHLSDQSHDTLRTKTPRGSTKVADDGLKVSSARGSVPIHALAEHHQIASFGGIVTENSPEDATVELFCSHHNENVLDRQSLMTDAIDSLTKLTEELILSGSSRMRRTNVVKVESAFSTLILLGGLCSDPDTVS